MSKIKWKSRKKSLSSEMQSKVGREIFKSDFVPDVEKFARTSLKANKSFVESLKNYCLGWERIACKISSQ